MVLLWRACSAPTSSFYCQWCLSKTGSRSLIWGVWSCSSGPDTNVAACKKQSFKAGTVPSYLSLSLLFAVDLSVHLFYKHKNMFVGFTYACTHRCITHTHTPSGEWFASHGVSQGWIPWSSTLACGEQHISGLPRGILDCFEDVWSWFLAASHENGLPLWCV